MDGNAVTWLHSACAQAGHNLPYYATGLVAGDAALWVGRIDEHLLSKRN